MILREATESDWAGIWPFMSIILAAGDTYCFAHDATAESARTWWMGKPGGRVFVAVDDAGAIIGTAELHPNQPASGSHIANAGFMVDPAASGRGVGRALATHVIDRARELGYTGMQFNAVLETNTGAVGLWRSLGFSILATVPGAFKHPSQGLVGLHLMHRTL